MFLWLRDFPGWRVGQDARSSCLPGEVAIMARKPALRSLEASTLTLGFRLFTVWNYYFLLHLIIYLTLNIPFKTYLWSL